MNMRQRAEIIRPAIEEITTELKNAGMKIDEAHAHIDRTNPYSPVTYIRVFGEYEMKAEQDTLLSVYGGINGSISMWNEDDQPTHRNYTIMIMVDQQ
jgi:hypothetical protein